VALDNRPEAIQTLTRLLSAQSAQPMSALKTRLLLGSLCAESGQLDRALQSSRKHWMQQGKQAAATSTQADILSRMATVYKAQSLETEARDHFGQAADIYSNAVDQAAKLPDSQAALMGLLNQLQIVQQQAGTIKTLSSRAAA